MSESGPTVSTNSGGDGGGHKKGGRGDGPPKKKFPPKENKASTEHPPVEHNQQGERPEGKGGRGGGAGRGSGGRGPPKFLKKQDPATEGNEEAAPNTDKDSHPKAKKANQFPKKDSPAPHTTKKEATNTDAKKDTDNTPKRTSHKLIIRKLPPSKDFRKDEFQNCIHKVIEQLTSMTGKQIEQDLIKVEHFIEGKIRYAQESLTLLCFSQSPLTLFFFSPMKTNLVVSVVQSSVLVSSIFKTTTCFIFLYHNVQVRFHFLVQNTMSSMLNQKSP